MKTVWEELDMEYVGSGHGQMDGVFIPIPDSQRTLLGKALRAARDEAIKGDKELDMDTSWQHQYYMERLEATHWFIFVTVPDDDDYDSEFYTSECTWWDFATILAKQVDGVWYTWSEDPGDEGNIWYQTTYRKHEAYGVRELAIECASAGELYNEFVPWVPDMTEPEYWYVTQRFGNLVKERVMTWW
jgi:hypothetical protein